ncbi:MAG TPA: hypothetical protein VGM54_22385 [Chthoniobacter sp.]|jgi:hypothetical protein
MARKPDQRHPEPKSKTGLRRGQFTPGIPSKDKAATPRDRNGTSRDEEAMLFGEPPRA